MVDRKEEILRLRQQNLSHVAIASELNMPLSTVRHIVVHQLGIAGRASENGTSDFWRANTTKLIELYTTTAMSNSEIGAQLGASSGSISSRLARLIAAGELSSREKVKVEKPKPVKIVYALGPPRKPAKPIPATTLAHFTAEPARVPLLAIHAGCRWPFDPVGDGPWTFCGCDVSRPPYCHHHARLAFERRGPSPCDCATP